MHYQLSTHGIRVHVLQLLFQLLLTQHIEIVESSLPKCRAIPRTARKCQRQLSRHTIRSSSAQCSGNLLLQHLQHFRWRALLRLTEKQMHVLRHPRAEGSLFSTSYIPVRMISRKYIDTQTTSCYSLRCLSNPIPAHFSYACCFRWLFSSTFQPADLPTFQGCFSHPPSSPPS